MACYYIGVQSTIYKFSTKWSSIYHKYICEQQSMKMCSVKMHFRFSANGHTRINGFRFMKVMGICINKKKMNARI